MDHGTARKFFSGASGRAVVGDAISFVMLGVAAGIASAITLAGVALLLSGAA
jgi:hypothetical protein